MPDMKTLHSQAPRLTSRASNGNIREGFATIASSTRRISSGFSSLFSNSSPFGTSIPPVPSLPSSLASVSLNGNGSTVASTANAAEMTSTSGVVRQPRGPGVGGFARRDSRVAGTAPESTPSRGGVDAQTHEPLEMM